MKDLKNATQKRKDTLGRAHSVVNANGVTWRTNLIQDQLKIKNC